MHEVITLSNGVRILTEHMPNVRSAAIGFFIGVGSRHETDFENGAAHFIEHMLFKGTTTRSASALAKEMDALGGQVNAYTTKESTCFYARCLDTHLDRTISLLCDMLFCSTFEQENVLLERGVILEEIDMYEDTPEDLCAEQLSMAIYQDTPLGRPILGKASTLSQMDGDWLRTWHDNHYCSTSIVVSLAGSFTDAHVQTLIDYLNTLPKRQRSEQIPSSYRPAVTIREKAIEQNHLILAFPGMPFSDPRRYQLILLNSILGGGCSSRLFQELREQRGLCYTIYSYLSDYVDTGFVGIYAALGQEQEQMALDTIASIVQTLAEHGPSQEELTRVKEQTKANILMGTESVQARMSHMGVSTLSYGQIKEIEEILDAYDQITCAQLKCLAQEIFTFSNASFSGVGQIQSNDYYQHWLSTHEKANIIK